jgi:uncharacterized protein
MPHAPNRPPARLHFIAVAAGLCAAAAILRPDPANAQSFDCRQARHPDEMLICREPELAQLDQQLATLYREQIGKIPKERQDDFQQHETLFLNARHRCRDDYRCIEQSYRNRINELEGFLSEARREETSGATAPADIEAERSTSPRGHWSSRSELEASGSADAAATSEHRAKPGRTTAAAPQPRDASSGSTTEPAAERAPATNDAPAKPSIRWVDPPPAR